MERDYNRSRSPRDGNRSERPNRERSPFNSNRSDRSENRYEKRERGERPSYSGRSEDGERRSPRDNGNRFENRERGSYNRGGEDRDRSRNFNREDRGTRNFVPANRQGERSNDREGSRGEYRNARPAGERRFSRDNNAGGERGGERRERNYNSDRRESPYNSDRPVRNYGSDRQERSYGSDRQERNYGSDRQVRNYGSDRQERSYNSDRQGAESGRENRFNRDDRYEGRGNGERREYREHSFSSRGNGYGRERKELNDNEKNELRQKHYSKKKILAHRLKNENEETELRLNRYISMGGVCSRRDADELIKAGRVKVNGEVVQTVGVKVQKKDKVEVDGAEITPERKVYIVLNKPKDYVTTVEDPMERKTVMSLVEGACKERVYPVGRLDRQTTGVLLFTNDGDLAKKLTHPKYDHKKIYHVFLDKAVSEQDLQTIANGIELEDGLIRADEVSYASDDRTEVGIEIHSGKNRIVRRIFEHLGYQIVKLDRVYFAGITKKNIPRGKWRFLTTEEVNVLKFY